MLTVGSLFSGIGLLDLAVGLTLISELQFQVEIDPWRQRVLSKHFPTVPKHLDISTFVGSYVDLLFGGFPCQDVSGMGNKKGLHGERSGLWYHFNRLIRATHPGCVFIENVSGVAQRGLDEVLDDLNRSDYHTRYGLLGANDVGLPHRRQRWWILAYSSEERLEALRQAHYSNCQDAQREHLTRRCMGVGIPLGTGLVDCPERYSCKPYVCRATDASAIRLDRHRLGGIGDSVCVPTAVAALTGLIYSGV